MRYARDKRCVIERVRFVYRWCDSQYMMRKVVGQTSLKALHLLLIQLKDISFLSIENKSQYTAFRLSFGLNKCTIEHYLCPHKMQFTFYWKVMIKYCNRLTMSGNKSCNIHLPTRASGNMHQSSYIHMINTQNYKFLLFANNKVSGTTDRPDEDEGHCHGWTINTFQ